MPRLPPLIIYLTVDGWFHSFGVWCLVLFALEGGVGFVRVLQLEVSRAGTALQVTLGIPRRLRGSLEPFPCVKQID